MYFVLGLSALVIPVSLDLSNFEGVALYRLKFDEFSEVF
jgi:hypothetical protein